jgi:hypothetical protein
MPRYSRETIEGLKEFRKKGYSIHALMAEFSMPKTSIWHHIHSIKLPIKFISKLRSAGGESSRLRKEQALTRAKKEATKLLLSKEAIHYAILASLYWAEGSKGRFELVNTDGNMIRLYLNTLRNLLKINQDRIECVLRIFSNQDLNKAINYWSKITNIPKKKIKIYMNDGGTKGGTRYGMCRIIVRNGGYLLKLVKAMINQLSG